MTRVRLAATLPAATVLAAGCTAHRIAGTARPADSGPSAADPQPPQAWTSGLSPVETPHAAPGGFVLEVLGRRSSSSW